MMLKNSFPNDFQLKIKIKTKNVQYCVMVFRFFVSDFLEKIIANLTNSRNRFNDLSEEIMRDI